MIHISCLLCSAQLHYLLFNNQCASVKVSIVKSNGRELNETIILLLYELNQYSINIIVILILFRFICYRSYAACAYKIPSLHNHNIEVLYFVTNRIIICVFFNNTESNK